MVHPFNDKGRDIIRVHDEGVDDIVDMVIMLKLLLQRKLLGVGVETVVLLWIRQWVAILAMIK